ncbi:MAG TPA: DUF1559 domain-containing protein [Victivallales bacterium]|nr:DUF1559 domain-containing protein [Victivallales bacterium]
MIIRGKTKIFTLVELLVVIAIIALLAGLLFPVTMKIRAKGRKTFCLNNLRQIGQAVEMYASSYDYYLPSCTMTPSNPPEGEEGLPSAKEMLSSYLNSDEVFLCPSDPDKKYFLREGLSYEWQSSAVNGKRLDEKSMQLMGYDIFLMMDYDNFHAGANSAQARNYLYSNARALGELEVPR